MEYGKYTLLAKYVNVKIHYITYFHFKLTVFSYFTLILNNKKKSLCLFFLEKLIIHKITL